MNSIENDIEYMSIALKYAVIAEKNDEIPVGAIVVDQRGIIIGIGYNQIETKKNQLAHAEISAIQEATKAIGDWRLQGCTLYVTLEPCMMCFGLIHLSRIKRCVFGAHSPIFGFQELWSRQYANHTCEIVSGVLQNESTVLLKEFFKSKRGAK